MQSWGRSSYARAMIDLRADEESKDSIMVAMPKLVVAMRNFLVFFDELSWRTRCDDACCFFSLSCLLRWLLQDSFVSGSSMKLKFYAFLSDAFSQEPLFINVSGSTL
ncbi:hypothetical protein Tco_1022658 [Tanacetum coccineum]